MSKLSKNPKFLIPFTLFFNYSYTTFFYDPTISLFIGHIDEMCTFAKQYVFLTSLPEEKFKKEGRLLDTNSIPLKQTFHCRKALVNFSDLDAFNKQLSFSFENYSVTITIVLNGFKVVDMDIIQMAPFNKMLLTCHRELNFTVEPTVPIARIMNEELTKDEELTDFLMKEINEVVKK